MGLAYRRPEIGRVGGSPRRRLSRTALSRWQTRPVIFDETRRTDATPGQPNESHFQFLNRSASAYFGCVRDLMEGWLDHVPFEAQQDLVGAFRGDNRQHEAAFWELYLHEGYRRSGFNIEIHPAVPGSTNRPDFRLDYDGSAFCLEAVSVGQPPHTIAEDRRLQEVHRVLEEMRINGFVLGLDTYSIGAAPLSTRPLRNALHAWLAGLDPDKVTEDSLTSPVAGFASLPELPWDDAGWSLVFRAIPYSRGEPRRALGVTGPGEATIVDNVSGVRRVLNAKYGRYGALDRPLVIAVQSNTMIPTQDYEIDQALYGITSRRPTEADRGHFFEEGFWCTPGGWRRGDTPQVITAHGLEPWSVANIVPRLWSTLEKNIHGPLQPSWLAARQRRARATPGSEQQSRQALRSRRRLPSERPGFRSHLIAPPIGTPISRRAAHRAQACWAV